MRVFFYRVYQFVMKLASAVMPFPSPKLLEGENSVLQVPGILKKHGVSRVLLVTDKPITNLGLTGPLLQELQKQGINCFVYDDTVPNPTIENIEEALALYKANSCQATIAFGGGSSMDCAKGVGARLSRPRLSVPQLRGLLKVLKRIPLLIAVPTTAGTGSETTIAAVISNRQTHEKYAINDPSLIPQYAVLDPLLTVGLPPQITATTGMDALTHAVEAYIGRANTRQTREDARRAVTLIHENLLRAYKDGKDLVARQNMLKASFYAGAAFTKAYVGYVHALAHTLGGYYQVPHGLANAVILPYVLDYFGEPAQAPLAELADLIGLSSPGSTTAEKAAGFIKWIREMNRTMNIPEKIAGIRDEDLPGMVHNALRESNPLYPVPRELFREDFIKLYGMIRLNA